MKTTLTKLPIATVVDNPIEPLTAGFEISGLVHLGTGLMSMGKIADFLKAGVKCRIFLADFHSFLNNKFAENGKISAGLRKIILSRL